MDKYDDKYDDKCDEVLEALLARERGEPLKGEIALHRAECSDCDRAARELDFLEGALASLSSESSESSETSETLETPPFEQIAKRARGFASRRRFRGALRRALPYGLAAGCAVGLTVAVVAIGHRLERQKVALAGEVLDASRGTVQARLADGAQLTVGSGSLTIKKSESNHSVVRLETGSVFLEVPHRGRTATFLLETEEAEVHVQGTRFDVSRTPEGTRVRVAEGVVTVDPRGSGQKPLSVGKGETTFVSSAAQLRKRQLSAALESLDGAAGAEEAARRVRELLSEEPGIPGAAEAYARLAWKLSASGHAADAIVSYRRALTMSPQAETPLWADNAAAQLVLLLEREDPDAAMGAWRDYLNRFPGGVHAEIARARLTSRDATHR